MTDNKNFEMNDQELEKAAGGEYGYAGGVYTGDQIEFIRPYNDTYVYVFDPKTGQYGYTNCNYLVDPRTGRRGVAYPSI